MTIRNLDGLLHPRSIAVIGGSQRVGALGQRVLANVIEAGYDGPIYVVNPKNPTSPDTRWHPDIASLPVAPDLAIIVTPASTVPGIVAELGNKGTRVAVVISSGFHDPALRQAMLGAARPHLLRVIGPNGLGVILPHVHANGSFAQAGPQSGGLALLSQSGALITSMIDWANARDVGFSGIVSLGDSADVDFGDLIDLFAADFRTDAIALYVESITDPAKFMSAARAAARIKPVIVLKAGRTAAAGKAAFSHTGALAGAHDVHMVAFDRAGIVVVNTLTQLFDAAQILSRRRPFTGDRLAIVTNGGGGGVLAADAVERTGGRLAELAPTTVAALNPVLPAEWSRANPIDIIGDARSERFVAALDAAAADPNVDAILVMHCPTGVTSGTKIARAIVDRVRAKDFPGGKPVLACWMGPHNADAARSIFRPAGIALFDNLDDAVAGFGYLIAARQARQSMLRAPVHLSVPPRDLGKARAIIADARLDKRTVLTTTEAKAILAAFGIPVLEGRFVHSVDAVESACAKLQPPYALKIVGPTLSHKSDVGGVALDLPDPAAVRDAAQAMAKRIGKEHPEAKLLGFEISPMLDLTGKHELFVGIADDPTFGPIIAVGAGGKAVELIADRALGLPPLDDELAGAMIDKTRIARLLAGYRDEPPADQEGLVRALNAVSRIAIELPDIAELDINPLVADAEGVIALDARIRLTEKPARTRLVIRPVPAEWAADLVTRNGVKLRVRPVMPDDEALLAGFFRHVNPEDLRYRFLSAVREVDRDQLAAMTQIDYSRTMHFLAFVGETLVASAYLAAESDKTRAELAISVHADWKRKGVSWTLMEHVLRYAEAEGISSVESLESSQNRAALQMEREMGFETAAHPGDATETLVRKMLNQTEAAD